MTTDQVHLTELWRLAWSDLDPAGRPGFDPAGVAELVRALPPATEVPAPGTDWRLADFWFDRMTEAMVERVGDWVVGWWFTLAMEDYRDYGVIPVWRAERPEITTPDETLARIADAVVAWHELIVELATDARGRFAAAAPAVTDGTGEPAAWRAVQSGGRVTVYAGHPRPRLPHPARLSWAEADPTGQDFDPETVPAAVAELVAASALPSRKADWRLVDLWLENVTAALADRYGL